MHRGLGETQVNACFYLGQAGVKAPDIKSALLLGAGLAVLALSYGRWQRRQAT